MTRELDLAAYFTRINYAGRRDPTLATLRALCICHLSRIPFECLDPFLGIAVNLEPTALWAKLVHDGRGGYCHEHNAIFHDVLEALGFSVVALGARVVWTSTGKPAPLTHRLTLVDLPEGRFIADVGFGGQTPPAPLVLKQEVEQYTEHGAYRVRRACNKFELELRLDGCWRTMYQFDLSPQTSIDFEVANWFTSTHPKSRFTQNLIACRLVGDRRINLLNRRLTHWQSDGVMEQRTLTDSSDLRQVLERDIGLTLPMSPENIWEKIVQKS